MAAILWVAAARQQEGNPSSFPYVFRIVYSLIAAANWKRERIPSFWYALLRCRSTVFSVTNNASAISRFVRPSAA